MKCKEILESADDELKRYLMKDVYDKLDQLNKMYIKAKQLGDSELMSKVKVAMAKVAAKKSKLASDLGISEAELDEMNAPTGTPQPGKIQKVNPDGTADIVDPAGNVHKVDQKSISPDSKDPNKLQVNIPKPKLQSGANVSMVSEQNTGLQPISESKEISSLKKLAGL